MSSEIALRGEVMPANLTTCAMSITELIGQVRIIQEAMQSVMHEGADGEGHYGVIPGTKKKTLYKAGAEKLCMLFRLDPEYDSVESWDGVHLTVKSKCTLYHIPTGQRLGSGEGMCSTRESKYAYRQGKRVCPACGSETALLKSKNPPRDNPDAPPGWFCWAKKGGCGANFAHDNPDVIGQSTDRVQNPDLADQYNTVLKMANKRSLTAAVLNVTAASDIFTQDLEELRPAGGYGEPGEPDGMDQAGPTQGSRRPPERQDDESERQQDPEPPRDSRQSAPPRSNGGAQKMSPAQARNVREEAQKRAKALDLGSNGEASVVRKAMQQLGLTGSSADVPPDQVGKLIVAIRGVTLP